MHNKVVYRVARALRHTGAVVLRLNFRGVGLSEGSFDNGMGELDDARAALNWLLARYPDLPFSLAGFSFGSRVILRLGCRTDPRPKRMIAVGFPSEYQAELAESLAHSTIPKVFIQSTHDQFALKADTERDTRTSRRRSSYRPVPDIATCRRGRCTSSSSSRCLRRSRCSRSRSGCSCRPSRSCSRSRSPSRSCSRTTNRPSRFRGNPSRNRRCRARWSCTTRCKPSCN